jgi:putative ABC transport system permease protein
MAFYLAFKEIWRNKGRFFLFSLVIGLITVLVLFIAALAQGLAEANKQYIEKLNAELIVFQNKVGLSTTASRIGWDKLNDIRRISGVRQIGPIGFASGTIILPNGEDPLDISLIGAEPGKPGMAPAFSGENIRSSRGYVTVIDANVARQTHFKIGDEIVIKTIQGTKDQFNKVKVIGITDGRQYFFQPTIFLPFETWDKIKPQPTTPNSQADQVANVVAVQLINPSDYPAMAKRIASQVQDVEVVDPKTAYEAAPGYQAQQSTLNTQRGFTLLIGILVIGGFFQIQTLQKVPQIGVLKAIGTTNPSVAGSIVLQIFFVTILGVTIGTLGTLALTLTLPAGIPIMVTGNTIIVAILSLLLIGPIGGMVSVRLALRVEPLRALGM